MRGGWSKNFSMGNFSMENGKWKIHAIKIAYYIVLQAIAVLQNIAAYLYTS
jgi:hypothetical protein